MLERQIFYLFLPWILLDPKTRMLGPAGAIFIPQSTSEQGPSEIAALDFSWTNCFRINFEVSMVKSTWHHSWIGTNFTPLVGQVQGVMWPNFGDGETLLEGASGQRVTPTQIKWEVLKQIQSKNAQIILTSFLDRHKFYTPRRSSSRGHVAEFWGRRDTARGR